MFLFIVATCSFSACSKDDETPPIVSPYVESRTVMVYMVAENSLNKNVWADVQEMLVGMNNDTLSANDRLVIYLDDVKLPRIYVVDKTTKITQFSELVPVMTYENDVNSSSAEQLGTFIDYVKSNYPAESYGLVMWSHASGWTPSNFSGDMYSETPTKRKSFGVDNGKNTTNNNGNQMNIDDMASVLQGNAFDFIFFDACVMQTIEVAYELRDAAKWLIASPAEIPASGANYETMTRAMFLKDDYVTQMLTVYKQEYSNAYGIVVSAVNTEALDDYAAYMKSVVAAHRSEMLNLNISSMLNYIRYGSWTTTSPDFLDMQGIMLKVLDDEEYAQWKGNTDKLITCVHTGRWYSGYPKSIIAIDDAQCCGMAMFIPFEKYTYSYESFNEKYLKTSWAKAVWIE
jgi:hypothetical protein